MRRKLASRYLRGANDDMPKDKRGNFRRLASSRTTAALDTIRKIENLSNRTNYDYTDEEVGKIFTTLRDALEAAEGKFRRTNTQRREFRL